MTVTSQKGTGGLEELTKDLAEFKKSVIKANIELVEGYRKIKEGH